MTGPPPAASFDVIPAIDLAAGQVVRLVQGRFEAKTTYANDPVETARGFWRDGARHLHVVDLDAARTGERSPAHAALIKRLVASRPAGAVIQIGGGLRSQAQVDDVLELGADRVVVGTLAFADPALLALLIGRYDARIIVSADYLEGVVRVAGWQEDAGLGVHDAVQRLTDAGVSGFLLTAIERDGTLAGPDVRLLRAVRSLTSARILASGGVASADHVRAVREAGADGVIIGRALLAGSLALRDALAL